MHHRQVAGLTLLIAGTLVLGLMSLPVTRSAAQGAGKPNIVLIVADDLGYNGLSSYGSTDLKTPNIDSIGKNGVRCTDAYVSCPVCSPTRAGLLTGRYQQRFGHEFNPGPAQQASAEFGLPLTESTLADRLKAAGYATGMVGKWHLGYLPQYHPQKRGFDEYFGFLGGAHSYTESRQNNNNILRGTEAVDEKAYLTDALQREAIAFVDRHQRHPFFLYLPFNAVHAPMQAASKYLDRVAGIEPQRRRTHAAMLTAMDDAVGALMAKLTELKLEEKTLVFFISDNGGPTAQTTSKNDPLKGFKAQVLEGGIRVPFMVQWKGQLPAGKTYSKPVIALDIFPTALAAAGVTPPATPALDGVNLLPYLEGKRTGDPHDTLYWRFGPQAALRHGNSKILKQANGPWQLYDLAADIGEKTNLAKEKPEQLAELVGLYDTWNAQLMAPRWGRGGANPGSGGRRPRNTRR